MRGSGFNLPLSWPAPTPPWLRWWSRRWVSDDAGSDEAQGDAYGIGQR